MSFQFGFSCQRLNNHKFNHERLKHSKEPSRLQPLLVTCRCKVACGDRPPTLQLILSVCCSVKNYETHNTSDISQNYADFNLKFDLLGNRNEVETAILHCATCTCCVEAPHHWLRHIMFTDEIRIPPLPPPAPSFHRTKASLPAQKHGKWEQGTQP